MIDIERFQSKVDKLPSGCWKWLAAIRDSWGYGSFSLGRKILRAHRASWILYHGDIPVGLCVLHHCDHPWCVNPNHLFLGTIKDNVQDAFKKGRMGSRKGTKNPKSKLTYEEVDHIREGYKRGMTQCDLAEKYRVNQTTVSCITRGKTWTWQN